MDARAAAGGKKSLIFRSAPVTVYASVSVCGSNDVSSIKQEEEVMNEPGTRWGLRKQQIRKKVPLEQEK